MIRVRPRWAYVTSVIPVISAFIAKQMEALRTRHSRFTRTRERTDGDGGDVVQRACIIDIVLKVEQVFLMRV